VIFNTFIFGAMFRLRYFPFRSIIKAPSV